MTESETCLQHDVSHVSACPSCGIAATSEEVGVPDTTRAAIAPDVCMALTEIDLGRREWGE
jgi:hypothetical protein